MVVRLLFLLVVREVGVEEGEGEEEEEEEGRGLAIHSCMQGLQ